MLKLETYNSSIGQFIDSLDKSKVYSVVCPSPEKADIFREIALAMNCSQNLRSVTISKFVSDHLQEGLEVESKSDLLIRYWTFWKQKNNRDYIEFRKCFDLFTEIRSFTLEAGIFSELENFITPEEKRGMEIFHLYLEGQNLLDEQASYRKIDAKKIQNDLIFWGFDHLNGNQIDMIKEASKKIDVIIPIEKTVYEKSRFIDWPMWIDASKNNLSTSGSALEEKLNILTYVIPEGRISQYLQKLEELKFKNIFLLKETSDFLIPALTMNKINYKQATDIFENQLNIIFSKLRDDITNFKKNLINFKDESLKNKNIIALKIILTLIKEADEFQNLSIANEKISLEDLECLQEKLRLDLPRVSKISLVEESDHYVLTSDYLNNSKLFCDSILFVSKEMAKAFQFNVKFSPEIMKVLAQYGPIQSVMIALNNYKALMKNYFQAGFPLILEDGAFDHLSDWEDFVSEVHFDIRSIEYEKRNVFTLEVSTEPKVERPAKSATALQTYIDCPRKYYYNYMEKLEIRVNASGEITPDVLGTMEHLIIKKYIESHGHFDQKTHREFVNELYERLLTDNKYELSQILKKKYFNELIANTAKIIAILMELKSKYQVKYEFEYDISKFSKEYTGQIDLLVELGNKYLILDFKRSSASIPTNKAIINFDKIQALYYVSATASTNKVVDGFGYINLSEIENSLIILNESSLFNEVFNEFPSSPTSLNEVEFSQKVSEFNQYIGEVKDCIRNDQKFEIAPKNGNACDYCLASSVCAKGGGVENE